MATATGVYHTTYRKDLALRHTRAEYVRLGLPALRLKGLYLAISTFAAQEILSDRFRDWKWLVRGHGTVTTSYPTIGGHPFKSTFEWYWLLLVITGLVVLAGINLFRTGLG